MLLYVMLFNFVLIEFNRCNLSGKALMERNEFKKCFLCVTILCDFFKFSKHVY